MKGTVVHCGGRFRRVIEGRSNNSQVKVEVQNSEPSSPAEKEREDQRSSPAHFTFYINGQSFAASQRVTLIKGRRYPQIEHWFVAAD